MKCDCDTSNSEINTQKAKEFSAKSIYESFFDVLKYSNYKVLKCFKITFRINNIIHNIGSIIAIIFFLIYLIFLIIYFIKGISHVKTDIINLEQNKEKKNSNNPENIIGIKSDIENNIFNINNGDKLKWNKNIDKNISQNRINFINYIKTKNKEQNNKIIRKIKCNKKHNNQKIIFTNPPKRNINPNKQIYIQGKNKKNIIENKYDNNNIIMMDKSSSLKISFKKDTINKEN